MLSKCKGKGILPLDEGDEIEAEKGTRKIKRQEASTFIIWKIMTVLRKKILKGFCLFTVVKERKGSIRNREYKETGE